MARHNPKKKTNSIGGDFTKLIGLRVTSNMFNSIQEIVNKNQDIYYNESHYLRSLIMKDLRERVEKQEKALLKNLKKRDNERRFNYG